MNLKLGDTQLIIAECIKEGLLRNQAAYVLATAYHESAHTMKPIAEMGSQAYLRSRKYWPYIGRGYVQLTWDYIYKKASGKLGVDFMAHPELLMQAQYAVPILVEGMKEGWFTGRKLSDYMDLQHSDFLNARREINSMDKASLIASYAVQYDSDLKSIGYGSTAPTVVVQPVPAPVAPVQPVTPTAPVTPPTTPTDPAPKMTIMDVIVLIFKGLFGGIK